MDIDTILRKVKRQFGDEYGVIIRDIDIYDWINEGQRKIIRNTTSNDSTVTRVANTFPVTLTDRIMIKRVAINNRALKQINLAELDDVNFNSTQTGTPTFWYYDDAQVKLWPTPLPADTYNVLITYAKLPTDLTLVAPYLRWVSNPVVSPSYATIAADVDFDTTGVKFRMGLAIDTLGKEFLFLTKATNGGAAATFGWSFRYKEGSNRDFEFAYSSGAAIRTTAALTLPGDALTAGQQFWIEASYNPTTAVWTLSRYTDSSYTTLTGSVTDDQADGFNLNAVAGQPIVIGGFVTGITPTTKSGVKVYYLEFFEPNTTSAIWRMDGTKDIATLPVIQATPFPVDSGHSISFVGNLQEYKQDNVLTVPDLWHDDLYKLCLARAHEKNRNFTAYEKQIEEFNENVATSRHEADSVDAPTYKIADSADYDWVSSYG